MMRADLELAIGTFLIGFREKELSILHSGDLRLFRLWLKNDQFAQALGKRALRWMANGLSTG
jgi:hypothetical protein